MSSMNRVAGKNLEDIVTAATQVFLRYGYKRVTMADLAEAAHMSRPGLYLFFPSKEQVFTAVVARVFASILAEIRQELGSFPTAEDKLKFACEVWCVRPFEMILASPAARDLLASSYEFAAETTIRAANDFMSVLTEILDPLVRRQNKVGLSSAQIADLLRSALPGFKESAENAAHLRTLIAGLIEVVLASLQESDASNQRGKKRTARSKRPTKSRLS